MFSWEDVDICSTKSVLKSGTSSLSQGRCVLDVGLLIIEINIINSLRLLFAVYLKRTLNQLSYSSEIQVFREFLKLD